MTTCHPSPLGSAASKTRFRFRCGDALLLLAIASPHILGLFSTDCRLHQGISSHFEKTINVDDNEVFERRVANIMTGSSLEKEGDKEMRVIQRRKE